MEYRAFPPLGAIAQKSLLCGDFNLSVHEAARLMEEKAVSSIVIEQDGERYIFSIEDVLSFVHREKDFEATLLDAASRRIGCLRDTDQVLNALEYLERNGQRYLGVTDAGGTLVGIVTYSDILHSIDPSILMERRTVGDLISRTPPVMFTADWILEDVVHHIRKIEDAILVVEDGRAIGIVTAKDIFGVISSGRGMSLPLSSYMSSPVITTPLSATISDALLQLRSHGIKRAIIADEQQRVIGVVTQSELVGYAYGAWVNLIKHHTSELHELVGMLEEKTRSLEKMTTTDVLTGLGNRRVLHYRMLEEIERIRRYNSHAFSLVIIDLDRFKLINDKYGHLMGDEVLVTLARVIEGVIRKCDTAVRWGGEEFAVLLSSTSVLGAAVFANRLREIVEQLTFQSDIKVTISAGVGEYLSSDDESTFFQRVDRALYRAKSNGRNRVEIDEGI